MTATATTTNGKPPCKQLSAQLDRLDTIIDALAEALPEAVADATREGARQAVRDVILELLANPDLRALIAAAAPAATPASAEVIPPSPPAEPAPATPGLWSRMKEKFQAAKHAAVVRCRAATAAVAKTARTLAAVIPVRKILLVGAGVGLAVGAASYLCPHAVAAVLSGVGGACTAVGVQVGRWFNRSTAALGFGPN